MDTLRKLLSETWDIGDPLIFGVMLIACALLATLFIRGIQKIPPEIRRKKYRKTGLINFGMTIVKWGTGWGGIAYVVCGILKQQPPPPINLGITVSLLIGTVIFMIGVALNPL